MRNATATIILTHGDRAALSWLVLDGVEDAAIEKMLDEMMETQPRDAESFASES